jgi:hypothetical protein
MVRRCSELLDQRKQAKLQWLQDPSQINGVNVNNLRRKAKVIPGTKGRNILKTKLMSLQRTVRTGTLETYIKE